jgi:hypothetical protein
MQRDGCRAALCFGLIAGTSSLGKYKNAFSLLHERNHLLDGRRRRSATVDGKATSTPYKPTDDWVIKEFFFGHLMQGLR